MYKNVHESLIQSLQSLMASHIHKLDEIKNADLISQKCSPSAVRKLLERIDSTLAHVDKVLYEDRDRKGEANDLIKARPSDIHQPNDTVSKGESVHVSVKNYSPLQAVSLYSTQEMVGNLTELSLADHSIKETKIESFHKENFHARETSFDKACSTSCLSGLEEPLRLKSGFAFESSASCDERHERGRAGTEPPSHNQISPSSPQTSPKPSTGDLVHNESKKVISLIASEQPSQRTISISPYPSCCTDAADISEPGTKSFNQPIIHPTGMPISYMNVDNHRQLSSFTSSARLNFAPASSSTETRSIPLQVVSSHSMSSRPTALKETNMPKYHYKEVQMYQTDKENMMNFSRVKTFVRGPHYVI